MGNMKIYIPEKSLEQITLDPASMGDDAKPRKLKSCKGLSGFMLAATFRSPNPTNLELQPPPVYPPMQASASHGISEYPSTRSSREPSAWSLGEYVGPRSSGWTEPLPGTSRYPSYPLRTEEKHPWVILRYCENPSSQLDANPNPPAPYWSHPIPPTFRCPTCLIKVATIVFRCHTETVFHGCCTDCAASGFWCSMCQQEANVLSTLNLAVLVGKCREKQLSVGQIARGRVLDPEEPANEPAHDPKAIEGGEDS